MDGLPIVDFSKCGLLINDDSVMEKDLRDSGKELYDGLSTSGFLYLTNHGIDWSMVDDLNEISEHFYALPMEIKKQFEKQSFVLSYDSIGRSRANLKEVDYYEGFRVTGAAYEDETWPNVPDLKESFKAFSHVAGKLLLRILKALGYGMKLKDADYFCKAHSLINKKGNFTALKSIKYPPISADDESTANRIGEHTDKDSMTLLFQDKMGGLQVQDSSGKFIPAQPIPDAIVVNIGETLAAWSGNRLKATVHKVNVPPDPKNLGKIRRSIGYFGQADSDVLMQKLLCEDETEIASNAIDDANGKPLTVLEHMNKHLGAILSHKS